MNFSHTRVRYTCLVFPYICLILIVSKISCEYLRRFHKHTHTHVHKCTHPHIHKYRYIHVRNYIRTYKVYENAVRTYAFIEPIGDSRVFRDWFFSFFPIILFRARFYILFCVSPLALACRDLLSVGDRMGRERGKRTEL